MRERPPHILVTTPESLYILLTSEARPRACCRRARTVIVDEIHAVARDKRGAHLALSLERLDALAGAAAAAHRALGDAAARSRRSRASWSAPDARAASPMRDRRHRPSPRSSTSRIECPSSPLEAVMSDELWDEIYDRLAELIARAPHDARLRQHAAAGRARRARISSERLGDGPRRGAPRQPGARAAARRRAAAQGRRAAGAGRDGVARARHRRRRRRPRVPDRLAALDRDAAPARRPLRPRARRRAEGPALPAHARRAGASAAALLAPCARGELDRLRDAARSRSTSSRSRSWPRSRRERDGRGRAVRAGARAPGRTATSTRERLRRRGRDARRGLRDAARPARRLPAPRRGATAAAGAARRAPRRDHLRRRHPRHRRLRGRRWSRRARCVGTVNEDFAIESMRGDIFLLGNRRGGSGASRPGGCASRTRTAQPPTIPFWLGEAPARTRELSRGRVAPARRDRRRSARADPGGRAAGSRASCGRRAEPPRGSSSTTSPPRSAALGRHADAATRSSPSASSTRRAACSS